MSLSGRFALSCAIALLALPLASEAARAPAATAKTKARAGTNPSKSKPKPNGSGDASPPKPRQPRPLDELVAELPKAHPSKSARLLKQAFEALQAKKFAQAIKLAGVVKGETWSDWSSWITSQARYGSALQAMGANKRQEAIRDAEAAITAALRIESRSPYSPMLKSVQRDVGSAEILIGDAHAAAKKWAQALPPFERGFQRLASANALGSVRPDSLLHYAQSCSGHRTEFCQAWIWRFTFIYHRGSPEMQAVVQAFPEAADRPRAGGNPKLTQPYRAPDLDAAAFDAAMALVLDGKTGSAVKALRQFIDEFPKSSYRFRARFWLGQALAAEKDAEKSRKAHEELAHDSPLTYYGLLAAFTSGRGMDASISPTIPNALERDPLLYPHEAFRVARAEELLSEGAKEMAMVELRELKARDMLSSPFLIYLAALHAQAGSHANAFSILGDLIQRGYDGAISGAFLNLVFPLAHYDLIRKHAAATNLDPILVLSLIKQESAFDPGISSSVGAQGLMQLMPATATDTDPKVLRAELVDPDTNIRVGTKYLRQLLTRFNGNIVLALAGYNAGPGAADRWYREAGGKLGMLEFIEKIPYKETREYVGSIIRNYYWYSKKLNPEQPAKPLSFFWAQPAQGQQPVAVPASAPSPAPEASIVPVAGAAPNP